MNIIIVGATSGIAQETARVFAASEQAAFLLAGRSADRLEAVAADLRTRGASRVEIWSGDLTAAQSPEAVLVHSASTIGSLDLLLIAHGSLSDETRAATDAEYRAAQLAINLLSPMAFAYAAAARFRRQGGGGHIAVITSVAGERGRAKNFFYGSSKAALITFCQGLRASLFQDKIAVTELRPGFVATPMTADMPKSLLFTTAAKAGKLCHRAIKERRVVAYIPGYWALIMWMVRAIPEKIFQRMKF